MGGGGGGVSLLIVHADSHVRLALSVGTAGLLLARFLLRHSENADLFCRETSFILFFYFFVSPFSPYSRFIIVCPTERPLKFSYWQTGLASSSFFFFSFFKADIQVYVDCFDLAVVWSV